MPPRLDFRRLLEGLPGLFVAVLPDEPVYTIAAVSDAFAEARRVKREQVVGRGLFEVWPEQGTHPADAEALGNLRRSLGRVVSTKRPDTMPARQHEERYWSAVNSPVLGRDGEVEYIVHRVEAEAGPGETDERFSTAFAKAPIGMVLTTPDGKILEVNQAYVEMLGYSREELAWRDSATFTHPDDIAATREFFAALQQDSRATARIEKRYIRKDGRIVWVRASATMRRDERGRPTQLIAIIEDITERRKAEADLRQQWHTFDTALSHSPDFTYTFNLEGRFTYANRALLALWGKSLEEALGKNFFELGYAPELAERLQRQIRQVIQTNAPVRDRTPFAGPAGETRHYEHILAPVLDANGRVEAVAGSTRDITDQQRTSELQERLAAIVESSDDAIVSKDLNGVIRSWNRGAERIFGYTAEETTGRHISMLAPSDVADEIPGILRRISRGERIDHYETRRRTKEGKILTVSLTVSPIRDASGTIIGASKVARDITERKKAEKLAEEDRRRWRELLQQAPAAIAVLRGPEHRFEWANADYLRLAGRPAEALIGKTLREALPEMEGQIYVDLLNGVYQTGQPFAGHESLIRVDRGDGTLKDVYVNFVYLATRDVAGKIDGVFAHATDVTDMVAARRQIEESERQFRTLAESIPHLAWMADETGHIFWYNRRWYDYTGSTFEEMEGWGWQKVHDPKVLPGVLTQWTGAIGSGEPFEMVFPLRGADGEFRSFLTRVEPVKDNQGRVARWFGTNTDITEQRRTEEELRRMNRELEEFAYVASHDLQEPLRMVNIYTQMILRRLGGEDATLNEYAGFVRQGVRGMEALIHDLLTFSRAVHGEELSDSTADLAAALDEASALLKNRIEESGAAITVAPLPTARGDTQQLAHVFQNLLSNSLKYRKKDISPAIAISARPDGDQWIVSVRDNGIGFDQQYAERIFGLFKRLHKNEYPGTGLGLAICQRIVERYGGRMWAESRPGEGAAFHFSLPRVEAQ